jgi:hypothetical protein
VGRILICLGIFILLDRLNIIQHFENLLFLNLTSHFAENVLVGLFQKIHAFNRLVTDDVDFPLRIDVQLLLEQELLRGEFFWA